MSDIIEKPAPDSFGWYELAARRQPNVNVEGMVCFKFKAEGDFTACMYFCSLGDAYKRGPRKGERRLLNDVVRIYVHRSEVDALIEKYEEQSGQCSKCHDGQMVVGWSIKTGTRYKACDYCNGTGRAKAKGGAL